MRPITDNENWLKNGTVLSDACVEISFGVNRRLYKVLFERLEKVHLR